VINYREINSVLYHLTRMAARIALAPFFKMEVEGRDHLSPKGPFVILCKHQCWQDIPLLALASPWPLYYVAKYELFIQPLSRWFVSALGGVPLNRKRPLTSRDSIRGIIALIEKGERIVVFPEGTYHKNKMGPGHSGMIRAIHARAKVPFIPVGVHYGEGKLLKRVRIRFGQPLFVDESTGLDGFLARAMREIAELSDLPLKSPPDGLDKVCQLANSERPPHD
jgi:1-acyl-sn-glycerol-3-phosphate acyltransferase